MKHRLRTGRYSLLVLAAVSILSLSYIANISGVSAPFVSSELKFTDASAHGLAIVPASCASQPLQCAGYDSIGNCTGFTYTFTNNCSSPSPAPVRQCSPSYQCQGSDLYYEDASCSLSLAEKCAYGCAANACNPAPAATGTLTVVPALVKREAKTNVSWDAQNVVVGSCTVKGTNGDNWAGATGSQASGPIPSQTVYTLQCTGLDNTPLRISKIVNIAPGFCETGAPGCN